MFVTSHKVTENIFFPYNKVADGSLLDAIANVNSLANNAIDQMNSLFNSAETQAETIYTNLEADLNTKAANYTAEIAKLGNFEEFTALAKACVTTGLELIPKKNADVLAKELAAKIGETLNLQEILTTSSGTIQMVLSNTVEALKSCRLLDLSCIPNLVGNLRDGLTGNLDEFTKSADNMIKTLLNSSRESGTTIQTFVDAGIKHTRSCVEKFIDVVFPNEVQQ